MPELEYSLVSASTLGRNCMQAAFSSSGISIAEDEVLLAEGQWSGNFYLLDTSLSDTQPVASVANVIL